MPREFPRKRIYREADDLELTQEVAESFIEHVCNWMDALKTVIDSDNRVETKRLSHTLKNSADNVGCLEVNAKASQIEAQSGIAPTLELLPSTKSLRHRSTRSYRNWQSSVNVVEALAIGCSPESAQRRTTNAPT